MRDELADLDAFLVVAEAGGFREAARTGGLSASGLSDAVRRLEARVGLRLLNRTTRSVAPTEAGARLLERLKPALDEVGAALQGIDELRDRPAGLLRLNVPVSAAHLILPEIVPGFLAAYPDIRLEVLVEDGFVDVLAAGCDAGVRYDDRLALDMTAIPIGPREQRYACAAAPAYLDRRGRPEHPRDLLHHACLRHRFAGRSRAFEWEFERDGQEVKVDPPSPLIVQTGGAELTVQAALAGAGIIQLFEDWLRPHLTSGGLEPVLEDWWPRFSGPFLYFPGRRLTPPPLRAFIDYVRSPPPRSSPA